MLLQLVHVAFLIGLAWLVLGRRSLALFVVAITAIPNLMLSPFQMENFVWSMQIVSPLLYLAATAAFVSLSLSSSRNRGLFFALCVAFGAIASYTMANGTLIWPVLVIQAIYLRQNRKVVIALAAIGSFVMVSYIWHFARPVELGMGVGGMLRHPIDAILLLGLILGSPFRLHLGGDIAVGILAPAVGGCLFFHASYRLRMAPEWLSVLFAIILFIFLSAMSIIAGRLTPEYLRFDSIDPMPSRYFAMICLFWASLALLALGVVREPRTRPWLLCVFGIVFGCLMFRTIIHQLTEAEDWADVYVATDALGSALLLDVPDEQLLTVLWPSKVQRKERVAFLRNHRLAMFDEPRARWMGKRIEDLFPPLPDRCVGRIEKTVSIDKSSWRVEGWAWDTDTSGPPDDVLITDAAGRVIGLARAGLRHGYLPGFPIDPQGIPPSHAKFRRSEWLGYVRQSSTISFEQVGLYGLSRNKGKVCAIR